MIDTRASYKAVSPMRESEGFWKVYRRPWYWFRYSYFGLARDEAEARDMAQKHETILKQRVVHLGKFPAQAPQQGEAA